MHYIVQHPQALASIKRMIQPKQHINPFEEETKVKITRNSLPLFMNTLKPFGYQFKGSINTRRIMSISFLKDYSYKYT